MSVDGTAGRLVELGERERGAQFEAARGLLLRDGDGGLEGFFRRARGWRDRASAGFRRATDAVLLRMRDSPAVRSRQRFVEDRDGAAGIARPGFGLSQRDLQ